MNEPQNEEPTRLEGDANSVDTSAYHAAVELHHGRIEWLAEHIKRSDFHIDPLVARKILALIERTEPNLFFELRLVRRPDVHSAQKDPHLVEHRNLDMAVQVARGGGFKRGFRMKVCHKVGEPRGLEGTYVYRCVKPYRDIALEIVEAEQMQAAYERGEIDFLGRPISSHSGFAEDPNSP
ncbi:hypothetical protein [Erythrobacter litoralis]|nr:hypothetical protein [Erythrobacter litoralis]